MPVPEQYVGVPFRQIAGELRWGKDGDRRTNRIRSVRPIDERTERYADSAENPTLVTFAADDNVNISWLLEGAIERWTPPAVAAAAPPAAETASDEPAEPDGEGGD